MRASALRRCVGDPEAFLAQHWGQVPLLVGGETRHEIFDDLASLDALDDMISTLALRASSLRMVRDGKPLGVSSYTIPPGERSRGTEALVSPALVLERFHEGATIVLEGLHRYWSPLADFSRDLELELGHRLQVNAYITPPASRGFAVHSDDHDVFVLQVWGSKRWTVSDRTDEDRVLIDEEITRGSSLYIPAGFPHAASTTEEISAHLTVGVLTHEAIDVVREITRLASEEPVFRERLERHDVGDEDSLRGTVERQVEELRTWLDKVDLDELTHRVARRLWSTSQPLLRGQLRQLASLELLDAETTLRRRRGATLYVSASDGIVRALLFDRELELPIETASALGYVAEHEAFKVAGLHAHLDPDSALVLVRRLVREGLLEVQV